MPPADHPPGRRRTGRRLAARSGLPPGAARLGSDSGHPRDSSELTMAVNAMDIPTSATGELLTGRRPAAEGEPPALAPTAQADRPGPGGSGGGVPDRALRPPGRLPDDVERRRQAHQQRPPPHVRNLRAVGRRGAALRAALRGDVQGHRGSHGSSDRARQHPHELCEVEVEEPDEEDEAQGQGASRQGPGLRRPLQGDPGSRSTSDGGTSRSGTRSAS